jgi:hypothetical protein
LRNLETGLSRLAILVMLASYAYPRVSRAAENEQPRPTADAGLQGLVGKEYWIALPAHTLVCPELKVLTNCAARSGHFRVDALGPTSGSIITLRVTFDGQPTGWTATSLDMMKKVFRTQPPGETTIYPSFLDHLPQRDADARRKLPGIVLGMRKDEVLAGAWGEPLSRKIVKSSRGLREEWHYPHGNVLIFEDGVLEGYEK